jgi:hypothetical protein
MNKKQIILIAATATGLYLVLRGLKKNSPTGLGEEFKNAIGDIFKKKKKIGQRANATRCETNLERLGRLFPNNDQYNEQVGLAYQKQGSNFSTWAQSDAKPCFVVGADQGGLQSGGINFTANDDFFNGNGLGGIKVGGKPANPITQENEPDVRPRLRSKNKNRTGLNFTAGDDFFNANGCKKPTKSAFNNYIGSQGQGTYFNAHGDMSLANLVRGYKRP